MESNAVKAAPPKRAPPPSLLLQSRAGFLDWRKNVFGLEQLQSGTGDGIDPEIREMYLDGPEFEKLFKMNKQEWSALPQWTRRVRKKAVGIYTDVKPNLYQLKKQFDALDLDHSGALEEEELASYIANLTGYALDHSVFQQIDKNGSGRIEFNEFVQIVRPLIDTNVLRLQKEFQALDKDHSGSLDFDEVTDYYLKVKGFRPTQTMFQSFDKNKSGKIEFPEFVRLLRPVVEEGLPLLFSDNSEELMSESEISAALKQQAPGVVLTQPIGAVEVAMGMLPAKIHHPPTPTAAAAAAPAAGAASLNAKSPPTSPGRERPKK